MAILGNKKTKEEILHKFFFTKSFKMTVKKH